MDLGVLEEPLSDAHGRARKIDPEYTHGRLVRVATGQNQADAELIQGMLLDYGVPSIHRRNAAFDVPDFLAAGPRDILVPESGAEAAREVLLESGVPPPSGPAPRPHPGKLTAGVVAVGGTITLVAWLLDRLTAG